MSDEIKNEVTTVTDSKNRVLTIKEPDFLQEARINRIVGDASTNIGFMTGYCLPAVYITSIDGNPVPFPTTYLQLEALIARVGREGRDAVAEFLEKRANAEGDHEGAVKN